MAGLDALEGLSRPRGFYDSLALSTPWALNTALRDLSQRSCLINPTTVPADYKHQRNPYKNL